MLNGKTFYVFTSETEEGKFYSWADAIQRRENLLSIFAGRPSLKTVNACQTRKEADELARFWNECYKKNGTYAFA